MIQKNNTSPYRSLTGPAGIHLSSHLTWVGELVIVPQICVHEGSALHKKIIIRLWEPKVLAYMLAKINYCLRSGKHTEIFQARCVRQDWCMHAWKRACMADVNATNAGNRSTRTLVLAWVFILRAKFPSIWSAPLEQTIRIHTFQYPIPIPHRFRMAGAEWHC